MISVAQVADEAINPAKLGLLWTTQWLLKQRTFYSLRYILTLLVQDEMRAIALVTGKDALHFDRP